MRRLPALWLLAALLTPISAWASSPESLLDSMKEELARNMEKLRVPDYPAPYYIGYLLRDMETVSYLARFGQTVKSSNERQRVVYADVRVGSPALDNSEDPFPGMDMDTTDPMYLTWAPLKDNDMAVRRTLWMLTDREYKKSVASFMKVKAKGIYQGPEADFSGSFTSAPVVDQVGKQVALPGKTDEYLDRMLQISNLIGDNPLVFDSLVGFDVTRHNRYFVNSEGSRYFTSEVIYSISIEVFARADDGTVLPNSLVYYARTAQQLPTLAQMKGDVATLLEELTLLAKAPILLPYSGPTLLEGDTAGVFLHEALGHRLEGHRQDGQDEGGTFRGKVGDLIMPEFLDLVDNPSMAEFQGKGVNGYYTVDDEGVVAQKVELVKQGRLVGFLMTRRPMDKFNQSNGHARASWVSRPVARMGTLVLTASQGKTPKELKERLMALAREQGKPYGIIVRRAASGATNTSSWGFQAFKGLARMVYKVDATTGEETLVRGVELLGTPLSTLMRIDSVGLEPALFNGFCGAESGWVPVSTVTPSLLIRELEFQKAPPRRENREILPPPTATQANPQ